MTCQRCLSAETRFRAVTDLMNIAVCAACAEEASKLGIAVEIVQQDSGGMLSSHSPPVAEHGACFSLPPIS